MSKRKNAPIVEEKHIVFNTHIIIMILLFAIFLGFGISGLASKEDLGWAIFFLILCLLPIYVFLISPMYVVFTPRDVTVVYLWGIKERIEWKEIRNITSYGSFFVRYGGFPRYQIAYPKKEKYPFFVDSSIPRTHKVKKMVKRYYKGKII